MSRADRLPLAVHYLPAIAAATALAIHFGQTDQPGLAAVAGLSLGGLLSKQRWALRAVQALLAAGAGAWGLAAARATETSELALLLGGPGVATVLAALPLLAERVRDRHDRGTETANVSLGVFLLTAALLAFVHVKVARPMLLVERFLPGWGWLELFVLAAYGGWLAGKLLEPRAWTRWRGRLWTLFTVVFFAQLILGLAGIEQMLQTGELHLPIPAMIVAGPLYRGGGFFMVILFLSTVVLLGPAWCSFLCYIGAWDHNAATHLKRPQPMPRWRRWARWVSLGVVAGVALLLRYAGLPGLVAVIAATAFGVAGVGLMVLWSRRRGVLTHCTTWCPVGLVATRVGQLNPFRVRIAPSCTRCGACSTACRFDALSAEDIERRRPGPSCTLCGDCLPRCQDGDIGYRFPGLSAAAARQLFVVLVVSFHAAFVGLARI